MVSWTRSSAWRGIAGEPERDAVQRIEMGQRLGVELAPGGRRLGHGKNVMDPTSFRNTNSVPTPAAVPALLPLSLLEAIRNLDTPVEDGLDELAEEIVVRRLGPEPDGRGADPALPRGGRARGDGGARRGGERAPAGGPAPGRRAGLRRRGPPGRALRRALARAVGADARAHVARGARPPGVASGGGAAGAPDLRGRPAGPGARYRGADEPTRSPSWPCRTAPPAPSTARPTASCSASSRRSRAPCCTSAAARAGDDACVWRSAAAEVYE